MNKKIAFLFPGQGAQYVGMGKDFFENFFESRKVFEKADKTLGYAFSDLIFEGDADELTLTKNSQLAIFITSIAILRAMQSQFPEVQPTLCSGLSLGEYTALVAANILSFEEALLLVKARGEYMQKACEDNPGTMNVVLGLDLSTVQKAVFQVDGVWVANLNCPGQIVISGTVSGIEKCGNLLKEKGARRVMPLDVSGAFHSGLMQPAQDLLEPMIEEANLHTASTHIVMNVSGEIVDTIEQMQSHMIQQVTNSVCWQKGIETMVSQGAQLFIEMGPGKSLSGMNKKIKVPFPTYSIEKIEDLKILEENLKGESDAIAQR